MKTKLSCKNLCSLLVTLVIHVLILDIGAVLNFVIDFPESYTKNGQKPKINWTRDSLAISCSFNGNDMHHTQTKYAKECLSICKNSIGCTHFVWVKRNKYFGNCMLKTGITNKTHAIQADNHSYCGIIEGHIKKLRDSSFKIRLYEHRFYQGNKIELAVYENSSNSKFLSILFYKQNLRASCQTLPQYWWNRTSSIEFMTLKMYSCVRFYEEAECQMRSIKSNELPNKMDLAHTGLNKKIKSLSIC